MARHEAEAVLTETAEHLRKALDLLDGLSAKTVMAARLSLSLEDVREQINMLRVAGQTPSLSKGDLPHALG